MADKYSDTVRNAVLNAIETIQSSGGNPKLRLNSGTPPADDTASLSGSNLLAEFTMAPAAAATGTKNMIGSTLTTTDTAAASAETAVTCSIIYINTGSPLIRRGLLVGLVVIQIQILAGQTEMIINTNTFPETGPGGK